MAAVAVAGLVVLSTTLLARATVTERSRRLLAGLVSTDGSPTPRFRPPTNGRLAGGALPGG